MHRMAPATPPENRATGCEPERLPAHRTFVVRLAPSPSATATGTIQHLRPGERQRFEGFEQNGPAVSPSRPPGGTARWDSVTDSTSGTQWLTTLAQDRPRSPDSPDRSAVHP